MAEITGNTLIQDWYDRYVKPLKQPISLSSPMPQDMSLGLPPSPSPTPQASAPPPMEATAAPTPTTPTEGGSSWSDNLNKGMQDPAKVGLLGAGLSMMATPPRNVPYSGAEIIGNAGLHGLKFFQQAVDDKRKQQTLDVSQEERQLSREQLGLYREGMLEDRAAQRKIGRQNAASSEELKGAAAEERRARATALEELQQPISPMLATYYGLPPETTKADFRAMQTGIVATQKPKPTAWKEVNFNGKNQWVDLNSPESKDLAMQGAFGVKDKPGYVYFVGDDGRVTEIEKGASGKAPRVVAPPGTGKKTKPGGAGGVKQFEYQDIKAKKSLQEEGVAAPTIAQIAERRQKLFPKGTPKAAGRNPRAELAGATRKVKMPDGSVQEFDAAGNRVK